MAIPQNIEKDHIVKAIQEINKTEIPSYRTSYNYDLLYNSQKLPPKYVISIANKHANNIELDPNEFNAIEAVVYLRKNGFKVERRKKGIPFKNIMVYEVKKSASENYENLFDKSDKYFFWNEDKFINLDLNDPVFVINVQSKTSFLGYLDKIDIPVNYYPDTDTTIFEDQGNQYHVSGKWNNFVRLKIKSKANFQKERWRSLGNSEITYFYGSRVGKDTITNNLNRIEMLRSIYADDEDATKLLSLSAEYLEIMKYDETKIANTFIAIKDLIAHVHKYAQSKGFHYDYEEIANFYLSLRAKPFVILAGISGTGKTKLPRLFAEACGFSPEQVIQVAVRPDWTDSSDLLGYISLEGKFIPKAITIAIEESNKAPDLPFFFILDEMNLARVEHYFSDYLSIIETREFENNIITTDPILKEEYLRSAVNKKDFNELVWPQNLYLIGTVNMDETTHAFSRKVLDRANSIEMNEINLEWIASEIDEIEKLKNINNSYFITKFIGSKDLNNEQKISVNKELELLKRVNSTLQNSDLHFAYRVRDEVAFYLILSKEYKLLDDKTAMDFQLVQKVLPRIHGSSERIQKVLIELLNILENADFSFTNFDIYHIGDKLNLNDLKYKRSTKKIIFMLQRFDEDRFTSFWL